jgi:alkyl sulfatase BDS1-like metallo-beta-lactamase superfamily hydrolase
VAAGERYVRAMGGADAAVAEARRAFEEGDLRWAAEVLDHVVFADEHHAAARALQADVLEQLGFGAENGTWRNAFLCGAHELRHGNSGTPVSPDSPDLVGALTVEQILSSVAIRVDGPRAWRERLTVSFVITDELRHGTLVHRRSRSRPLPGSTTLRLSRPAMLGALLRRPTGPHRRRRRGHDRTRRRRSGVLARLVGLLDPPDGNFPIVTP